MNKALLLLYDGFADFEVNLVSFFLKSKNYEVKTFTIDDEEKVIAGESGLLFQPHKRISDVDSADSYDLITVPGGPIYSVMENTALLSLVKEFHKKEKWVTAICAGTALLARAGILKNVIFSTSLTPETEEEKHIHDWQLKQDSDVTVHNNIITAVGSAYVEFASQIIKEMGLYDPGEEKETLAYFKNQL